MQGQFKVAPARWWHVPGLSRLIREGRREPAAAPAVLWAPHWSPSLGLLQSVTTAALPGLAGPRSFVAEADGRPVGLAQMRPRQEPHHWEVVYLAVEPPGGPSRRPVDSAKDRAKGRADGDPAPLQPPGFAALGPDRRATRLLGELCDAGPDLGAERIFARIEDEDGRYEVFTQVGFAAVVREYEYFREATEGPAPQPAGLRLRPQQRADAFGLLQLYQAATPKVVQMAEGLRSRSWDLPARAPGGRLAGRRREARWVLEEDSRKVAWLRLRRSGRGARAVLRAQLLVDPRASRLTEPLLEVILATAVTQAGTGVLVEVREHQQDLLAVLERSGFRPVGSRLLMVKQLAAAVRQPMLVPALEKAV